MGAHTRVAVETLKVPFVYHTLVANRADYNAHLWLAGLSIILVSEGSEADDFSPQPGTLNIGEYEPGTIALAAMGTGLCT